MDDNSHAQVIIQAKNNIITTSVLRFYKLIISHESFKSNTKSHYFIIQMNGKMFSRGDEQMDAKARIRQLMDERQWTEYRLAIASGLSQSTVANIFNRNTTPSVSTLESICAGFGITLAQFFAEGELVELSQEQKEMFAAWATLTKPQKEVLRQLIDVMKM